MELEELIAIVGAATAILGLLGAVIAFAVRFSRVEERAQANEAAVSELKADTVKRLENLDTQHDKETAELHGRINDLRKDYAEGKAEIMGKLGELTGEIRGFLMAKGKDA